jgi:hypothetical protein
VFDPKTKRQQEYAHFQGFAVFLGGVVPLAVLLFLYPEDGIPKEVLEHLVKFWVILSLVTVFILLFSNRDNWLSPLVALAGFIQPILALASIHLYVLFSGGPGPSPLSFTYLYLPAVVIYAFGFDFRFWPATVLMVLSYIGNEFFPLWQYEQTAYLLGPWFEQLVPISTLTEPRVAGASFSEGFPGFLVFLLQLGVLCFIGAKHE